MPTPQVTVSVIDRTTRSESLVGIEGAILVDSSKGPWNPKGGTDGKGAGLPTLVSSQTDFLDKFGTPKRGADQAIYSALQFLKQSDKLWVKRVAEGDKANGDGNTAVRYGAIVLQNDGAVTPVLEWEADLTGASALSGAEIAPHTFSVVALNEEYVLLYGVNPGAWNNNTQVKVAIDHHVIGTADGGNTGNGTMSALRVDPATLKGTYVLTFTSATAFGVDDPNGDALPAGVTGTLYDSGTGLKFLITVGGTPFISGDEFTIAVTTVKGAMTDVDNGNLVPSYKLEVYHESALVETWFVSPFAGALDGRGRSGFLPTVLLGSRYIAGEVESGFSTASPYVGSGDYSTMIALSTPSYLAGGVDNAFNSGSPVQAITFRQAAIAEFEDILQYPTLKLFIAGGWGSVNTGAGTYNTGYAATLVSTVSTREDDSYVFMSASLESQEAADPFSTTVSTTSLVNEMDAIQAALGSDASKAQVFPLSFKINDEFNGREDYFPAEGFAAEKLAQIEREQEAWTSISGPRRGGVNVLDSRLHLTLAQETILHDIGYCVIRNNGGQISIWSDRTAQTRPSFLSQGTVRRMVADMVTTFRALGEQFLQEFNDQATAQELRALLIDRLEDYKARRAIGDLVQNGAVTQPAYAVEITQTDFTLAVDLFVRPTTIIEQIPIRLILVRETRTVQVVAG
jgi:hypothetical protein